MNVLLFGATGMAGQGVLRECLLDDAVKEVVSIGRSATGQRHPKLRDVVHTDFEDFSHLEAEMSGFDACFFCLGVSSAGMAEETYYRLTYGITLKVATILARRNRQMTFIYISGSGTDTSERSRMMWARVKGKTENGLLRLPFHAVYLFRPGLIVPLDGVRSRTRWYRMLYTVMGPFLPWLKAHLPKYVTSTAQVGRAMIRVAQRGAPQSVLETVDINQQ